MIKPLHIAIFLLLLNNPLWSAPVTMLEVGHFDVTGGPLLHQQGDAAVTLDAGAVCELMRTEQGGAEATLARFIIGEQARVSEPGYFLSDWIPVEFSKDCKLLLRIYPRAELQDCYFESPGIELQPGRQQVGFATSEWTYHGSAAAEPAPVIHKFGLRQSFPNPFNATATIEFELSESAHVRLELFNLLGQRAPLLVDESLPAGNYRQELDGAGLATGVYLLRLSTSAGQFATRKLTLLK